ncbi:hypothetical protein TSUD_191570 [Trifolium subterraneum]|uniref:Uncharacterized protein n=1 Tax=Trifolium subterraneum TaxID=3900 RepID=A0A2Z6LH81_TRISU|nr:hypothetical protein TSUD_191570 [Trifolium subterraneum]
MGNCVRTSFDSSQVEAETAKVVVHDDEMGFDDVVLGMHEDDVLRLGQLYFALPLTRLKKQLSAMEMAALAVKANSALNKNCSGKKNGLRRKNFAMFSVDGNRKPGRRVAPESDSGDVAVSVIRSKNNGRRRNNGAGGGRGKYMVALSSIPE